MCEEAGRLMENGTLKDRLFLASLESGHLLCLYTVVLQCESAVIGHIYFSFSSKFLLYDHVSIIRDVPIIRKDLDSCLS